MLDVQPIFDWLVEGAPGAVGAAAVVQRMCDDLHAAGVPVERVAAYVRTLHPHVMGRSFMWKLGGKVAVGEAPYALLRSKEFLESPMQAVYQDGRALRRKLVDAAPRDFPVLESLAAEGFTDYLASPLRFLGGEVHCITFATKQPGGFSDEHVAALTKLMAPLSRIAEILALGRVAVNLLDTYVGHSAGERIIAGRIQRGDTETIRAVLWCSDLRGFTELAGSVAPSTLIGVLNDLFECQVPAIERHGGEVLKFIGDGLLAIFPLGDADAARAHAVGDAAVAAASEAFAALASLNDARAGRGEPPIRFGLALHVGDVAYGNIGGAGRLDFTCIGPAVNLAARLEGLTGKLTHPWVASAEFARLTTRPMKEVGAFELKGVAGSQTVFAPAAGP